MWFCAGNSGFEIKCPYGWSGFSESQSCYKFYEREENFLDADMTCENTGGKLAIVNSKAGNWLIINMIRRTIDFYGRTDTTLGSLPKCREVIR